MFFMLLGATTTSVLSQQVTVSGRVINQQGESFPGVNVVVEGTTIGTITDLNGTYSLTVPSANSILVFSAVGFTVDRVMVGDRREIDVTLRESIEALEEFVVVGYGVQRRQDLTSSIATLDPDYALKMPGGVAAALQGQVAGVQITDGRIRIRGVSTLNSTDPLWVVDGFVGATPPNPNEIESIQILKDAAAAAIYGARAANGVIIVTTKRGTPGETKIEYHGFVGTKAPWRTLDLLDARQHAVLIQEAIHNLNQQRLSVGSPADQVVPLSYLDSATFAAPGTDWQDEFFRRGSYHTHNLAVSGGNEISRFRFSLNYSHDQSVIIRENSENYGAFISSEHKKGIFTVGQTLNISQNNRQDIIERISEVWRMTPNISVFNPDNLGGFDGTEEGDGHDMENPIGLAYTNDNLTTDINLQASAWVNVQLARGLVFRTHGGFDRWAQNNYNFTLPYRMGMHRSNDTTILAESNQFTRRLLAENTLTYMFTLGKHSFNVMAGVTSETSYNRSLQGRGEGMALTNRVLVAATTNVTATGRNEEWAMFSLLGRINYNFDDRFLITANVRRDGSSRFHEENRYGVFPSISAAWRISQEPFIKNGAPFISDLKIRGSYGILGNDLISLYAAESVIDMTRFYIFNDQRVWAYAPTTFGTPGLKWESSISTGFGLDAGFFDHRLTFTFDYFDKTTEDILIRVQIPSSSGIDGINQSPWVNAGSINNKGLEMALNYRDNIGDWGYSVGVNVSSVRNRALKLGDLGQPIVSGLVGPLGSSVTRTIEGGEVGAFWGHITDGIYQSQAEIDAMNRPILDAGGNPTGTTTTFARNARPGDIRFRDLNGDGLLNELDQTVIGSPIPELSFGANMSVSYRSFDLSMLWQGDYGNEIFNNGKFLQEGMMSFANNNANTLDRWRDTPFTYTNPATGEIVVLPVNTDTNIPRAIIGDPNGNIRLPSDRFVEDGSYLRLKRITLGFTVPQSLARRLNLEFDQLRFYVGAKNLLTFTNYSGYDPEVGDRGGDGGPQNLNRGIDVQNPWQPTYPQAREFFAGVQFSF